MDFTLNNEVSDLIQHGYVVVLRHSVIIARCSKLDVIGEVRHELLLLLSSLLLFFVWKKLVSETNRRKGQKTLVHELSDSSR